MAASYTKKTIALFWRYSRMHPWLGSIAFWGFTAAFAMNMVVPIYYKFFFDTLGKGVGNAAAYVPDLVHIVLMIFLLNIVQQLLYRIAGLAFNRFQPKVLEEIANDSFAYLHGHSVRFFHNRFVGSLVRKVNRLVASAEKVQDRILFDIMPLISRLIVGVVILLLWHPIVALAVVIWTIVFLAANTWFARFKMKWNWEISKLDSEATGYLAETITNNQNVKLFTALGREVHGFKKLTKKQRSLRTFVYDLENWGDAAQGFLMIILEFVVFWYAAHLWGRGEFSIGDFALVQVYLIQIFSHIWSFGRIVQKFSQDFAEAQEMTEILNTPHEVQDAPGATQLAVQRGDVTFDHVTFAYHKTRTVVKDFSLTVHSGEKIGLVGPSGAGKTTIVGLLFRFFDVTSGHIRIDGQDIARVTQDSLRDALSFVPQDPILFHRSLMENIRYGKPGASDEEVVAAARAAHCDAFIATLPEGYQTFVGERGIKLSGGERQRVAIARAILKNAPILVLDEATSSLDSEVEALIQDALAKLMEGKTTIVIAHRLSTINKMDRIIVIDEGHIKEEGTHDGLLQREGGLYKKLWELQAGGFIG